MAFGKQSEAQMRNDLQSALNDATAPPPDYISTENVTTMQPGSRGAPIYGDMPSSIPTFTPIYTNQNPPVGPKSVRLRCPQCKCMVESQVRHRSTVKTHLACLLLSWTCCCCCLPYCMDTCRNANHFCPMCSTFIGTYES